MAEMKTATYDPSPSLPFENTAFGLNTYGNNAYGNAGYSFDPPTPMDGGAAPPVYPGNTVPVVNTVAIEVPMATTIQRQGAPSKPAKYLVHNILVLIFCCIILGIIGIIKGSHVDILYSQGHYDAAVMASLSAKKYFIWGLLFGVAMYIFFVPVICVTLYV